MNIGKLALKNISLTLMHEKKKVYKYVIINIRQINNYIVKLILINSSKFSLNFLKLQNITVTQIKAKQSTARKNRKDQIIVSSNNKNLMGQTQPSSPAEPLNYNYPQSNISQILKHYKPFTNNDSNFSSVDKSSKFIVFQSNHKANNQCKENNAFNQGKSKDILSDKISLNKQYIDKINSKNDSSAFLGLINYYQLRQNITNTNQQQESNILKLIRFEINANNGQKIYPSDKGLSKKQANQKQKVSLASSSCRLENLFLSKVSAQPTIQRNSLYRIDYLQQFHSNTLQKQLIHRSHIKQSFKQRQIWSIIYCSAQAANKMIGQRLKEPMLSPKTIFIDQNSNVKVGEWELVNYYQHRRQYNQTNDIGLSFHQEGETILNLNHNHTFNVNPNMELNVNSSITLNSQSQDQSIFSLYYWAPQGIVSIQDIMKLGQLSDVLNSQQQMKNNQVFSLGMSVLSMLTLKTYYQKSTFSERQLKNLIQNCINFRNNTNESMSSSLSCLLQKMLSWDALERFSYSDIINYVKKTYQQCKQIFDVSYNEQSECSQSSGREFNMKNQYINSIYTQMSVNIQSEQREINSNFQHFQTQYFGKTTLRQINFDGIQAILNHNDDYQPQFQQQLNTIFTRELQYDYEDQINYLQSQNTSDFDQTEHPDEDLQQTNVQSNYKMHSYAKQVQSPLKSIQNLSPSKNENLTTFFKQKDSISMQKQNNMENKQKQFPKSSYNLIKVKQIVSPCLSKQSKNQLYNQVKDCSNTINAIKLKTHTDDHLFTDPYLMAMIKEYSTKNFNINYNLNTIEHNTQNNCMYEMTPSFDFIQQKQKCQRIQTKHQSQRLFNNQISLNQIVKDEFLSKEKTFSKIEIKEYLLDKKEQLDKTALGYKNKDPITCTSIQSINSFNCPQIITQEFSLGYYQGQKENNLRHGYGTFHYKQGGKYQGNWYKNQMQGYGRLYYQDGRIAYDGQWMDDSLHGMGILYNQCPKQLISGYDYSSFYQCQTFQYWTYYRGHFQNDEKSGQGQLVLSNGEKYVGYFSNDMVHGYGMFYKTDGTVIHAQWQNNHLKQ